jgi:hypothetical protein
LIVVDAFKLAVSRRIERGVENIRAAQDFQIPQPKINVDIQVV